MKLTGKAHLNQGRIADIKRSFMVNTIVIGVVFMVVYTALYAYLGAYLASAITALSLLIFVPIIWAMLYTQYLLQCRIVAIAVTVLAIVTTSIALRNEVNAEYYLLPSMMLSLLLFEPHQKKAIGFTLFLPVFTWLSAHYFINTYDISHLLAPFDFPYAEISLANFIGSFFLTYIFLWFYSKAMQKSKEIEIENEQHMMQSSKLISMGQLASGIAHEINNPLAVIVGRTQLLKNKLHGMAQGDGIDPQECRQNLEKIENTATLITKIIKGLHAFSHKSENDVMLPQSIKKIVDTSIELCDERAKQFDIKVDVISQTDIIVMCRDVQITQVLVNLINNSIDAIKTLQERWIKIEFHSDDDMLYLAVTDSGLGIPPALQEKIMLPFFSTKETGNGLGIGLSISKGIAESHKGFLVYDNKCKNTRFILQIPNI